MISRDLFQRFYLPAAYHCPGFHAANMASTKWVPLRIGGRKSIDFFATGNTGSVVLGLIIEAVSGEDYYEYIRKNIYQPAGMPNSDHFVKTEISSGKAVGYFIPDQDGESGLTSNLDILGRMGGPAGGGYASANDLLAFANALYDDRLIDPPHREVMTTYKLGSASAGGYAYLYQDGRINGKRYIGHNGGAPGVNAEFSIFPDDAWTIIVLSNTHHNASPLADQIRQWVAFPAEDDQ